MPIYEYKCRKCGHRFSLLEALGDAPGEKECPKCGSAETNRILSVFSSLRSFFDGSGDCKPGG